MRQSVLWLTWHLQVKLGQSPPQIHLPSQHVWTGCPVHTWRWRWQWYSLRILLLRESSGGMTSHPSLSLHVVLSGSSFLSMESVFSHCSIVVWCYACASTTLCSTIPGSPTLKTFKNISGDISGVSFSSSSSSFWCILDRASTEPLLFPEMCTILKL